MNKLLFTRQDYVNMVKMRAKEIGRTPRQIDFGKNNSLPSATSIVNNLGFKTWNDVLVFCEVGETKQRNYNKEEALKNLKAFINNLGHMPTRKEYLKSGIKPSATWFTYNYGSFENALIQVGYDKEKELINILQDFYNRNGKSPSQKDMNNSNGLPSPLVYYNLFNTHSWNEVLTIAGLELNHFQGYTKEYAIKQLKEYAKLINKIPTREDFKCNNWNPHYDWYNRNFGSYEQACLESGLISEIYTDEERIRIALDALINLAYQLNRCPTVFEYEQIEKEHKGFCRRILEVHLKLNYAQICMKYIPQYNLNINRYITETEVIQEINRVKDIVKRTPTFQDLKRNKCPYGFNTICNILGTETYNKAIEKLGLIPSGSTTLSKSRDEMLEDFYELFLELKRVPYSDDLNDSKKTPSYPTYINHFGSLKNVCKLLDIDYDLFYKQSGAGKIVYDKKGVLCKSIAEKDITNYLIDNNIEYVKEYKYSEIFENDKRRFDWLIKLNNKYYYVEYFGLYKKNPHNKLNKDYTNRMKKKINKLYKNGLIENCIFIFPEQLRKTSLDNIFNVYIRKIA